MEGGRGPHGDDYRLAHPGIRSVSRGGPGLTAGAKGRGRLRNPSAFQCPFRPSRRLRLGDATCASGLEDGKRRGAHPANRARIGASTRPCGCGRPVKQSPPTRRVAVTDVSRSRLCGSRSPLSGSFACCVAEGRRAGQPRRSVVAQCGSSSPGLNRHEKGVEL